MFSSLRKRILIITLAVIALALVINATVSYLTVKSHDQQQIADRRVDRRPHQHG